MLLNMLGVNYYSIFLLFIWFRCKCCGHFYPKTELIILFEGVDRGGGGTGVEGAESGVEGAESGVEGAGSGGRGGGERG